MKAFLDTSVLIASFYREHQHHAASVDLILGFDRRTVGCAAHSLAEVYAVVTGMPGRGRASADEAMLFIDSIRERLSIWSLNEAEYVTALASAATSGISGGGVYDALLAHCALKAKAETLYTWNVKHFTRLEAAIARRVKTP